MTETRRGLLGLFAAAATGAAFAGVAGPAHALAGPDRFEGYGQALDGAKEANADFLLMYDSNHMNRGMTLYSLETKALDLAKARGASNIFFEIPREFQPLMDARAKGGVSQQGFFDRMAPHFAVRRMEDPTSLWYGGEVMMKLGGDLIAVHDAAGEKEFFDRLGRGLEQAHARGIRVMGGDSVKYLLADNEKRQSHDKDVAAYIAASAGPGLSIVTYGMAHGSRAAKGPMAGLDDGLARHGRVMTLELRETWRPDVNTKVGRAHALGNAELQGLPDRSPQWLNIDTGEFRSDPENKNTCLRGNPRKKNAPRAATRRFWSTQPSG